MGSRDTSRTRRDRGRSISRSPERRSYSSRRDEDKDRLHRRRSPSTSSLSDAGHKDKRRRRKRSRSTSVSSYTSSSETSSDDDRSRRKRKHSKHKKEKKKEKKSKKDKKSQKKKKSKSSKDKTKSGAVTAQYGAHGLITASDMYRKEAEFRTWLVEVKNTSPEVLDNQKMKLHFAEYMEDYNTATLPLKYYDLDQWERQQFVRQRAEAGVEDTGEFNILNDEERLKQHSKALRAGRLPEPSFTKDQLAELKKVSEERIAADRLRKMGYVPKDSLGVRYEEAE
ncbi:uncharacterized protein SPPG_00828 [Spizellomyces punctatus DAOM BR117]|uniref:ADP-ribosylation factor-like protein 6-interacting protein 4 n=1 Tax=Spizellomyces punctatus (strain DAOM BR117) TaxID=645134 RepID=A0A0L0HW78_SPIPD|nr:uncharacterized protein SPPG_00828 [Spizellomyces punctatus DAOM BR117]KND05160.1 hypothetical protein SPPG_00828 [Spizellomyces punctatus DAOM BR117]|eukprot:XP_016613199.1 hypothetical protein SPPG_00828 [Spizellomyces punctatus DAOM BR117]